MSNMYKIGDTVQIKEREGDSNDYTFGFADEMTNMEYEVFTITGIVKHYESPGAIADDGYRYYLDGCAEGYSWASSMFELVKSIDSSTNSSSYSSTNGSYKLNFNN